MSGATKKAEGHAEAISHIALLLPQQRVHLRRNVSRYLQNHSNMGSTVSSTKASVEPTSRARTMVSDADEEEGGFQPAKRRRVNNQVNGFSLDGSRSRHQSDYSGREDEILGRTRLFPDKPKIMDSFKVYGNSHKTTTNSPQRPQANLGAKNRTLDKILSRTPLDFQRSLHVDIKSIQSSGDEPTSMDATLRQVLKRKKKSWMNIGCKCTIAIFYANEPEDEHSKKQYQEICRRPKYAALHISASRSGEITKTFSFGEPFIFRPEDFYVTRKERRTPADQSAAGFDYSLGFADSYKIQIVLESRNPVPEWPPVQIPSSNDEHSVWKNLEAEKYSRSELGLACMKDHVFDADMHDEPLQLRVFHGEPDNKRNELDEYLNVRFVWSLPPQPLNMKVGEPVKPELTASNREAAGSMIPESKESEPIQTPRKRRHSQSHIEDNSVPNSPGDARATRRRGNVPSYNLKALSALAQGRSPRKEWTRESQDDGQITVTYSFGRADAVEAGIKQKTTVYSLKCPFCHNGRMNKSVEELRLHLHTTHSSFKFSLRRDKLPRISFFMEFTENHDNPRDTFQLLKPMFALSLEKHLDGDTTWLKSRQFPREIDRFQSASMSTSPRNSRQSSPNTSTNLDDFDELPKLPKLPMRPRKVYHVPVTSKPLYHTITKQVLKPGDEIPSSDDEKREDWRDQRQRDIVNDFTDVEPHEKEVIHRWNLYISHNQLTSDKFLSRTLLGFVEENKFWFIESAVRKDELEKLIASFIMEVGTVDERCLHKCFEILRRAENEAKERGKEDDVPMEDVEVVRRGMNDCGCGKPAFPPDRVVCQGQGKCPGRIYHKTCAKEFGRPIIGVWKCNDCNS